MPDIFGSEIFDIPRQQSRCRVMVYSHIEENPDDSNYGGVVDCSKDVIQCDTSKTIKAGGGASFVLVPRKNYLNYIYPNDYVHIYFDPGDGRGFIRVFFGFVDRVERTINTGGNGETTTNFKVVCSDFTKAFDKTQIYFNPHIADREDFVSQFFAGSKNINGAVLRTKGVAMYGTPADVVMSLATLLQGFGDQFLVPKSHPRNELLVDLSRRQRLKNALGQLHEDFQNLWGKGDLEREKKRVLEAEARLRERAADELLDPYLPLTNAVKTGGEIKLSTSSSLTATGNLSSAALQYFLSKEALQTEEVESDRFNRAVQTQAQLYKEGHSLLDMMDFSFVEYGAIDGSILAAQIWQSEGTLWSIMNAWANDLVNELFCDLRLVTSDQSADLAEGEYSKSSDEINGNNPDLAGASGPGVRTVPAMVMREYPFATVEGVTPPGKIEILGARLGSVPLGGISTDAKGPVFARDVNSAGRKVSKIATLNPWRIVETQGKEIAQKHLDVAVVSVKDIIQENIGRGDEDTVNLIEVYSDIGIGKHGRFFSKDVQPVSNPISIIRNGLRVRTVQTKYARWPTSRYKSQAAGIDSQMARFQTIRWALMMDHWYQHNIEYLNGSITTRAFPEIRVGYRLDIEERRESYYVESVNHTWSIKEKGAVLTSAFTLSRGQRNDPFPVYVLPALKGWGGTENRNDKSRLSLFFNQRNPSAVSRSSIYYGPANADHSDMENFTDLPSQNDNWSSREEAYLAAGAINISMKKNEEEAKKRSEAFIDTSSAGVIDALGLGGKPPITGGRVS